MRSDDTSCVVTILRPLNEVAHRFSTAKRTALDVKAAVVKVSSEILTVSFGDEDEDDDS